MQILAEQKMLGGMQRTLSWLYSTKMCETWLKPR